MPAASTQAPETNEALAALRRATRAHHDRVDRLVDVQRLQQPAHYRHVLQALDAFLAGWEPEVAAALPARWRQWLQLRSRRAFLQSDLRGLGIAPAAPAPVPALDGQAAAWGSIYVIEGSALGGQFIARTLARQGLTPGNGAAYFHGWGEATAGMWRDVRAQLAAHLDTPAAVAQACGAAGATFDALCHLLESKLHERAPAA